MLHEDELFEEYTVAGPVMGWVLVLGFAAVILGVGMFLHGMIPDTPRQWDFAALPDTPALSVYSTLEPTVRRLEPFEKAPFERLLPPLPWAKPLKPLKPEGYEITREFNE